MAITRSQIARQLLQEGGVSVDDRSTASLIDPRMNRSYDENRARNEIQRELSNAVRSGNFRDFLLQNVGAGGAAAYGSMYGGFGGQGPFSGTYQSMKDSLIDDIRRQRMNAPEPQPGLSERDMLPGIPGMRSLAEEDAIRRRILAAQMNESGRTFAEGEYANEAEAIADLGLERYNQLFSDGGEVPRKGFFNGGVNEADVEAGLSTQSMSDFSTSEGGTGSGAVDTGDLGSEEANVAATLSAMNNLGTGGGDGGGILSKIPTPLNLLNRFIGPFRDRTNLNRRTDFLNRIGYGNQFSPEFIQSPLGLETLRNMGYTTIQDVINNKGDENNEIVRPMMPIIPKLPTDIEPEKSDYDEFVQRFTLPERFRLAEGGEPRQAYGLGKLVKKVGRAVKKVVKSDVGKAALAGAAIYGLGGGTFFGRTLPGIGTTGGFKFGNIPLNLFGQSVAGGAAPGTQFEGLLSKIGLSGGYGGGLTFPGGKVGAGIAGLSAAAFALTPKQEEEVDSLSSRIADRTGIDVEKIRKEVQQAYASGNTEALRTKYPFLIPEAAAAADGGRIEKAIGGVINEEDEMLDMGGNEMDLRGGGFVPIGEYEKKDDVPARLSKNEFVFTADAVRAAGGGSVDRGADLMYKTMKQLENKVV